MTGPSGIRRIDAHGKAPNHSIASKQQVVQEYLAGETRHSLARRHDLLRTLIPIWVDKYDAGAFDEDAEAANTIHENTRPRSQPSSVWSASKLWSPSS